MTHHRKGGKIMQFNDENLYDSYEKDANIDLDSDYFNQVNQWMDDGDNCYYDSFDDDDYYDCADDFKKEKKKMKKKLKKQKKATDKLKSEVENLKTELSFTNTTVKEHSKQLDQIQTDVSFLKHARKKKQLSDNLHDILKEPDQRKQSNLIKAFADSIEEEF